MKQKTGLKDVIIINGFKWTPFERTLLETGSDTKKELMQLVSHAAVMCACEKILQTIILIFTTPINNIANSKHWFLKLHFFLF